jgi:predicted RNase H-like nuclease (RuvC/YqgF family)
VSLVTSGKKQANNVERQQSQVDLLRDMLREKDEEIRRLVAEKARLESALEKPEKASRRSGSA